MAADEKLTRVVNIARGAHFDAYCGRASSAPSRDVLGADGTFGNPFILYQDNPPSRRAILNRFEGWFRARLVTHPDYREKVFGLKGKALGCFCLPKPCHASIIADFLNGMADCSCVVAPGAARESYRREDEDFDRCRKCHGALG